MKRPRPKWILLATLGVMLILWLCRVVGFPVIRDKPIDCLEGIDRTGKADFYNYSWEGFLALDKEHFVRIDLNGTDPHAILSRGLGLAPAAEIPREFFERSFPWYWPNSRGAQMDGYTSPAFIPERGGDGLHFFAVHDRGTGRIFLWVKDNF